jgi:hypothetical protein
MKCCLIKKIFKSKELVSSMKSFRDSWFLSNLNKNSFTLDDPLIFDKKFWQSKEVYGKKWQNCT